MKKNGKTLFKKHYPFKDKPDFTSKMVCIHCSKVINVADYKIEYFRKGPHCDGCMVILCPNSPQCDGSAIDWFPMSDEDLLKYKTGDTVGADWYMPKNK